LGKSNVVHNFSVLGRKDPLAKSVNAVMVIERTS
jgi:hypothetical protein